ncbi:hypothetical protein LTS17_005205 [Exophiala oligosperma]
MARVKQKTRKQAPSAGASTRGAQVAKERHKHTVVVEGTSKEQNKLRSVVRLASCLPRGTTYLDRQITFRADPPQGYTFIPAGNPELTAALKEFARRGDHKIYAVTTTPHAARHELSREVHRIGFHFPTSVVAQVCSHYGIRLTAGGKVIDDSKDDKLLFQSVYQNGQRPKEEPKDQITINTEAKQTIKDLFPKMPDNDLFQIIKTAFQLGDNKVGTADEIPLIRRAQLSVVAHIRHVYTDYDKLLRRCPYNEARHAVEKDTLAKLIEWRGDDEVEDEATQRAADDLLREVIVISDEEDDETDTDDIQIIQDNVKVEELPSTAYGPAVGRPLSPYHTHPGEMTSHSYQALPRVIHRYKPSDDTIAQRDRSRYAVWDQARREYRAGMSRQPVTVLERIYEPADVAPKRVLVPLDSPAHSSTQVVYSRPPPAPMNTFDYEPRHISQPSPRSYIRDANGVLYERLDDDRPRERVPEPSRHVENVPWTILAPENRVRTRPPSPQRRVYPTHRQEDEFDSGRGSILESIEGPQGPYSPAAMRSKQSGGYPAPHDPALTRENGLSYRGVPAINRPDDDVRVVKRIRLEDFPSPSEARYVRRGSPVTYRERVHVPQNSRAIEYDNQRSTSTLRPAVSLEPRRYAQSVSEINRAAYAGAGAIRNTESMFEPREPPKTRPQPPTYAQEHIRYLIPEPSVHRRGIADERSTVVSRVYEPLDGQVYDSQTLIDRPVASREIHVQPPRRVYEYDDRVPGNSRPYIDLTK